MLSAPERPEEPDPDQGEQDPRDAQLELAQGLVRQVDAAEVITVKRVDSKRPFALFSKSPVKVPRRLSSDTEIEGVARPSGNTGLSLVNTDHVT